MIRSLRLIGFRGVRDGEIAFPTPLCVLVGANGCGKSTVLEGLYVALRPDSVTEVVAGRAEMGADATAWLFWRACLDFGGAILEEPEAHLHAAAMTRSARAIHAAVRRNIQCVVTTHSIELVDQLLATATADDLSRLAVIRLGLVDGALRSSAFIGPDVAAARDELDMDLR